jgi:hypothetical protein
MAVIEEKAFLVRFAGRVYRLSTQCARNSNRWSNLVPLVRRALGRRPGVGCDRQLDGGYRPQVHDQRADSPIVIASAEG